jgi:hypothetical protein
MHNFHHLLHFRLVRVILIIFHFLLNALKQNLYALVFGFDYKCGLEVDLGLSILLKLDVRRTAQAQRLDLTFFDLKGLMQLQCFCQLADGNLLVI